MRKLGAAALAALAVSGTAGAAPDTYLNRFGGQWAGSGMVQASAEEAQHDVSCTAVGKATDSSVSIDGTCRAYLIFSRNVGASLQLDPASGRYSGTYVGSSIGPAQLSGTRKGDSLLLTVTWPKDVNGDRQSAMTITSTGDNGFAIKIQDRLGPDGPVGTTTALNFQRQ